MSSPNSYDLRPKSPPSHINFSRPRLPNSPQASFDSIDPSLLPAPLQLRRPPSQAALQPQDVFLDVPKAPAQAHPQLQSQFAPPRLSFESYATIGTQPSFSADSVANSDLSSNDHFNLCSDSEHYQADVSDVTETCSDTPYLDTIPEGSICSEQFQLGEHYPRDWIPTQQLSGEANGHTATDFPFPFSQPQQQPQPQPYRQSKPLPTPNTFSDDNWKKGDACSAPNHPRIVERVSFDRVGEHLLPSATAVEQPGVRLRHSLEYNRQGSFGSFGSLTHYYPDPPSDSSSSVATPTDSSKTSVTKVNTNTSSGGNALSSKGSNLKRQWSPSTHDVSGLNDKKLARLHRRGINPALYQEMREARKRGCLTPLVVITYIG